MTVTERRSFLQRLAAGALALAASPVAARAASAAPASPSPLAEWDEKWMDALAGKYRQFFDLSAVRDAGVLTPVRNFYNAYRDAYGTRDSDVNAVVGLHGGAAAMAFTDSAWARFRLGQQSNITDDATRAPALANIFLAPAAPFTPDTGVTALQGRGAVFCLCNNSLARITRLLEAGGYGKADALRAELLGQHLVPGVVLVPAMMVTANRLQMRGVSYLKLG
ncbi:MAG: hypothetical protein HYX65_05640 [Gemmatimonadetes bacterium]|nr:hypothetical protein [Gemmatimonadota bacterium]